MSRLANPAIQEQVAKRLGRSVDEVAAMAITDPTKSVQDDVERGDEFSTAIACILLQMPRQLLPIFQR